MYNLPKLAKLEMLLHISKNPRVKSITEANKSRDIIKTYSVKVGDVIDTMNNNTFSVVELTDKIVLRSKEPISRTKEEKYEFSIEVGQSKQIQPAMFDMLHHWGITLIEITEE